MTNTLTRISVCVTEKHDPLVGHYVLVTTLAGRLIHGTGYYHTAEEARNAATAWLEGYRQMEEASYGPNPLA